MTNNPSQSKRSQRAFFILLFIGAICLPGLYFAGFIKIETVNMLGRYLTFAIVAVGLDLIWGYAGILSLCQAFFFCLGGYAMGIYLAHHGEAPGPVDTNGWTIPNCLFVVSSDNTGNEVVPWFWKPFWSLPVTAMLALLIPGLIALVIGYFGFRSRVRGVYFAILTQAITVAAYNFFGMNDMKFCGTNGFTKFDQIAGSFKLDEPNVKLALYVITVLALAAVYWGCLGLVKSRLGRVLVAIRDDETTLRFSGYRPYVYKLFAFVLAGMIAGLAGMLYVPQMGIINPSNMKASESIMIVIFVAVGGRGTLAGAVLGALVVKLLYNYFTSEHDFGIFTLKPEYWQFALGGMFIAVVLWMKGGLLGLPSQVMQLFKGKDRHS